MNGKMKKRSLVEYIFGICFGLAIMVFYTLPASMMLSRLHSGDLLTYFLIWLTLIAPIIYAAHKEQDGGKASNATKAMKAFAGLCLLAQFAISVLVLWKIL